MIHVVDHLKEKESVIKLNLTRILRALKRGEDVVVYHPVGKIHQRLADIRGVEYVACKGLGVFKDKKREIVEPAFLLANYVDPAMVRTMLPACNASLFRWKGKLMFLGRETNYTFRWQENRKMILGWPLIHGWPSKQHCYTNEVLYEFNERTNTATKVGYLSYVPEEDRHRLHYIGYEDVRLMEWGGELFASFTIVDNDHNFTMGHAKVLDDLTLGEVTKVPTANAIEKNWLPIEGHPHWYVYSFKPYRLINMATGEFRDMGGGTERVLRGSSPIICHRGKRICLAHINNWPACKTYVHVFVEFDEGLNIIKVTKPFSFFGASIEFSTSILSDGDNLNVVFSIHDQLPYRAVIGPDLFDEIMSDKLSDKRPVPNLYKRLYGNAVANENYKTAAAMATFVLDKDVRAEAAEYTKALPDVSEENRALLIQQLNEP